MFFHRSPQHRLRAVRTPRVPLRLAQLPDEPQLGPHRARHGRLRLRVPVRLEDPRGEERVALRRLLQVRTGEHLLAIEGVSA